MVYKAPTPNLSVTSFVQGSFTLGWSGWSDDLSGIDQFEVEVYKLTTYGNKIGYRTQPMLITNEVDPEGILEQDVSLSDPGRTCLRGW